LLNRQVRQTLLSSKSCKLISRLNPKLKEQSAYQRGVRLRGLVQCVLICFKHKAYRVMPFLFTLVIPSDFVEGF